VGVGWSWGLVCCIAFFLSLVGRFDLVCWRLFGARLRVVPLDAWREGGFIVAGYRVSHAVTCR
jgi:hypothetical protein